MPCTKIKHGFLYPNQKIQSLLDLNDFLRQTKEDSKMDRFKAWFMVRGFT